MPPTTVSRTLSINNHFNTLYGPKKRNEFMVSFKVSETNLTYRALVLLPQTGGRRGKINNKIHPWENQPCRLINTNDTNEPYDRIEDKMDDNLKKWQQCWDIFISQGMIEYRRMQDGTYTCDQKVQNLGENTRKENID